MSGRRNFGIFTPQKIRDAKIIVKKFLILKMKDSQVAKLSARKIYSCRACDTCLCMVVVMKEFI